MPLTKRQREILNYLSTYGEEHGYAPSFEEIASNFNYNSLATVHEHLSNLERKGYIKRSYNESRAIEILPSEATPRAVDLPLLGSVAAGMPIEMLENETFSVPETFVGRGGNLVHGRLACLGVGIDEIGEGAADINADQPHDSFLRTFTAKPARGAPMTQWGSPARNLQPRETWRASPISNWWH
jgi:hypothetical protein